MSNQKISLSNFLDNYVGDNQEIREKLTEAYRQGKYSLTGYYQQYFVYEVRDKLKMVNGLTEVTSVDGAILCIAKYIKKLEDKIKA